MQPVVPIKLAKGVGMVEILVTLFILSVGILGVASLQFIGTFTNSEAMNRSQAVLIAQQFSERLRANSVMSTTGNGLVVSNTYFDDDIYNFENLSCTLGSTDFACYCLSVPATITDCNNNACSAAEFAVFDAYEVSCALAANNPNVSLELNCTDNNELDGDTCSAGSRHSIVLRWPIQQWQNISGVLNAECNEGVSDPHDCVILDVTL